MNKEYLTLLVAYPAFEISAVDLESSLFSGGDTELAAEVVFGQHILLKYKKIIYR